MHSMSNKRKSKKKRKKPVKKYTPETLIDETLKMDRLLYLDIIKERQSLTSLQMTREILALRKGRDPEEIKDEEIAKANPNINKRLKDLADMDILNDEEGKYSLSPIGSLIIDELATLKSDIEVLREYRWFFSTHDYTVIPHKQFREIHKLRFAKECKDAIEYVGIIEDNTLKTAKGIRIATERLHAIPGWIMQELERGNLTLNLIYQFAEPFKVNSDTQDERKLWRDLIEKDLPKVEIRYLTLRDRNPLGIRIIDEKWAILNLFERAEHKLNRPRSFYGEHQQFVGWASEIFLTLWNTSKPIDINRLAEDL